MQKIVDLRTINILKLYRGFQICIFNVLAEIPDILTASCSVRPPCRSLLLISQLKVTLTDALF